MSRLLLALTLLLFAPAVHAQTAMQMPTTAYQLAWDYAGPAIDHPQHHDALLHLQRVERRPGRDR